MKEGTGRIAVLTVGDELLAGEVTDHNISTIGRLLSVIGMSVEEHSTVRDDISSISDAVRRLVVSNDVLIITGGLGPTCDDVTREAVAEATGRRLEKGEGLESLIRGFFKSMDRDMPEENLKQALVPSGARSLSPAGGTAPGFLLEHEEKMIVALPGVPREMKSMMLSDVMGELKRRFESGGATFTLRVNTFGEGESEVSAKLRELIEESVVRYGFLAGNGTIVVKLTASAESLETAQQLALRERDKVVEQLGSLVFGFEDVKMEEAMGKALRNQGLTLAVAESVTAGMVCSRIVNVPGSSDYFMGGVVTYSVESKQKVLGIQEVMLGEGTVTVQVARAMAESVRNIFSADLGVATTGLAGPGRAGEVKQIGTVCLAMAGNEGAVSWERRLPGNRDLVRSIASTAAMNVVRLYALNGGAKR